MASARGKSDWQMTLLTVVPTIMATRIRSAFSPSTPEYIRSTTWYYPGNGLGLARINSAYRTADLTHPSFMMEEKVLGDRR